MQENQDNPFEPAAPARVASPQTLRFGGQGAEYFRIWIVNVTLSLITLGIYSAWAKVRRLHYFYRQTSLAGSSFEYHGQPIAILKGRILAIALLILWNWSPQVHPLLFLAVALVALFVFPWLMTSAFRFRLHNSSYRGLRFSFLGSTKGTAKAFYWSALLMVVTFGLAFPYFAWRTRKYFFDHAAYGSLRAVFRARLGQFFRLYIFVSSLASLIPVVIFIGILILFRDVLDGMDPRHTTGGFPSIERMAFILPAIMLAFLAYLGAYAFVRARAHALSWNGLELGEHRFRCELNAWHFAMISIRNLILTALTLGLYKPFSDIQLTRLLMQSVTFECKGDLSDVVAHTQAETSAGGEETADFFDLDIGL